MGHDVIVGRAFVFVQPAAMRRPEVAWVTRMFGAQAVGRVLPLFAPEALQIFGAEIAPVSLAMRLESVTSDRAVYRAERDVVRLLVVRPMLAGTVAVLEVSADGAPRTDRAVCLDAHGTGLVELRDLPTGDYEVRLRGQEATVPPCSFVVAEYRLAPLVACMVEKRLEGSRLGVTLRLETFGVPVEGRVGIDLLEQGRRVERLEGTCHEGLLSTVLTLAGAGPFEVALQLLAHPSRTASVPLVGSRAEERSLTVFSALGTEVEGALLPWDDSRCVRGVWLGEGATRTTPFRVESIDGGTVRVVAAVAAEHAVIGMFDAGHPRARADAWDPGDAQHPLLQDAMYQGAERLFKQGEYAMALTTFRERRSREANPHCFLAYYEACCLARLGRTAEALGALRQALGDGWRDLDHMAADEDLVALRGLPAFRSLCRGGWEEVRLEGVAAGQAVDLEAPSPAGVVAIGAFIQGRPWEGWAATVAPVDLTPSLVVPAVADPGSEVTIEVGTGRRRDARVYLVVKDSRLPALDTPGNRLAGCIKGLAEAAGRELAVGYAEESLVHAIPPPPPPPVALPHSGAGPVRAGGIFARARDLLSPTLYAAAPVMEDTALSLAPLRAGPACGPAEAAPGSPPFAGGEAMARLAELPTLADEPEVLLAALLDAPGGVARETVRLGPAFTQYAVEAFVADGAEWATLEKRFQAVRDPFVSLDLPAYVHAGDHAWGRVMAGCRSGRMSLVVMRDGAEVPLLLDGRPLVPGEEIEACRCEVAFVAAVGDYEVTLRDRGTGASHVARQRVEVPGRLRRRARAVRILQAGERVERGEDIVGLRVLPSLERPLRALVDATAGYGHACCEQTAAKMLAACAMHAMAAEDAKRRGTAEAIVIAGVERMRSMWLPGRGFKMYPECPPEPNDYWGQKAARYLWHLDSLRAVGAGPALSRAVAEGLEMAADACCAYRIAWPPTCPSTLEEAWSAVRFGADQEARGKALSLARREAEALAGGREPCAVTGGGVAFRADCAFAAAVLLRAGSGSDPVLALRLANRVTADLGPEGRLYSTVDSVAALALMEELNRGLGAAGRVEVNGRAMATSDAAALAGEVTSVAALEGRVTVEVESVRETDWGAFSAGVDMRVALEMDGRARRSFRTGDALDLLVRLEAGYQAGDILWVCLPPALSRLVGGAQVKRFAMDFAGSGEVRVPLVATSPTTDAEGCLTRQHFAVCVRNMFEEERGGNPGLLEVAVEG